MSLTLTDYEELRQLFARLAFNLDAGNAEAYAADFAEDGSFEVLGIPEEAEHAGKHRGRDGVAAFVRLLYSGTLGHCRHWNQNFVFEPISDDEVVVRSYLIVVRVGEVPRAGVILTGVYTDRLVKRAGAWKMQERFIRADPQPEHAQESTDVLVMRRDALTAGI